MLTQFQLLLSLVSVKILLTAEVSTLIL